MDKRVLVSVSCVNEFASDVPSLFSVQLTDAFVERIKALASAVQTLGVHAVEEFSYAGTWINAYVEADELPMEVPALEAALKQWEADEAGVEVPMLRVTADEFCFTAVPKHCNDDMAISTRIIPLAELDRAEPFIAL